MPVHARDPSVSKGDAITLFGGHRPAHGVGVGVGVVMGPADALGISGEANPDQGLSGEQFQTK